MSILGYSSSYFLPEYWAGTPLYGEKIIPLIDYILSSDYEGMDKLAGAFYDIANKYKNTAALPLDKIEAIIDESGYKYVRDLLAHDEPSTRLLVSLLVLIHQWKGSETGIRTVLEILKSVSNQLVLYIKGNPTMSAQGAISDFTLSDYAFYTNWTTDNDPFTLKLEFMTSPTFGAEQCIFSTNNMGLYLGISSNGNLVFCAGNDRRTWNIANRKEGISTLSANTKYFVEVEYTGDFYYVRLSEDDKRYEYEIEPIRSTQPLRAHKARIFLGVDFSEGTPKSPYKGKIFTRSFVGNVDDIDIREWFEEVPVEEENTFSLSTSLNTGIVNTNFFEDFSEFLKRYVYPTLRAFTAKIVVETNIAILAYVRERVTYIAKSDLRTISNFQVVIPNVIPKDWEDFFTLNIRETDWDAFTVLEGSLD